MTFDPLIQSTSRLLNESWGPAALIGFAAFCGSIPFGYLIGKLRAVDIRKVGSGNIGTTNVMRVLGPLWGGLVLFLDFFKAYLPLKLVHLALTAPSASDLWMPTDILFGLMGIAVVLGHNYTPFLCFKGGKGIASSAGVLLVLMPWSFYLTVAAWLIALLLSRYASVGSIIAALFLPLTAVLFYSDHPWFIGVAVILSVLAIIRHRSNLERLKAGTEPKFGRLRR